MKILKPKYEIIKYTLFKNQETQELEEKEIKENVYTEFGLFIRLLIYPFLYDNLTYKSLE